MTRINLHLFIYRYYSVVRRPMDLSKMEEKLENGCYKNQRQFKKDFCLIVDNCRQYNGSENGKNFFLSYLWYNLTPVFC